MASGPKTLTEVDSTPAAVADIVVGTSGAAAVKTYAAAADIIHAISQIIWSYGSGVAGGRLTIENGSGVVILDIDIAAAGPNYITFTPPLEGTRNTAMIITLAAPGGSVIGKLNIRYKAKR